MSTINQNEPYIARRRAIGCLSFKDALIKLICSYFIFDICYSKALFSILVFIQCYILGIKDKTKVPNVVTRVLTSLDQHEPSAEL